MVLRATSTRIYDKLKARQYAEQEPRENLDSEIMQILLEEARKSYDEEIIVDLESKVLDDIESNGGPCRDRDRRTETRSR